MKRDIYKEIPEDFHDRFCQTLTRLEDTPVKSGRNYRKYGIILAAAVLACASVTAVAAGIMEWHEKMSQHFGTEKELEDKLSMENVAVPQNAVTEGNGLEFRALQAVRTDTYDYFLVEMTVPEKVRWNSDIIFEECEAGGGAYGCVAGFDHDSFADHKVLLELQVLYGEGETPKEEEICVRLKNLVQTEQLNITEYLAEGEWELNLSLPPAEANTVRFYPESSVILGGHELLIEKVDISPFRVRLYTEREFGLHAVWGNSILLTGILYEDGTVVEESGLNFSFSGHTDEKGDFCFEFPLENAVDTDKVAEIVISDNGEERRLSFGQGEGGEKKHSSGQDESGEEKRSFEQSESREEKRSSGQSESGEMRKLASGKNVTEDTDADGMILPMGIEAEGTRSIVDAHLLYVRFENVVLETCGSVYLWDARCGGWQELFCLDEYGFSWEDGGEFCMGNASQLLFLPRAGSEEVYMYEIAGQNMLTLDAETFWPWATYDSYRECCKEITAVIPEADERYSGQAFGSQGNWYYLYSEDGQIGNMELRVD